jgi:hypothetical protein
MLSILFNGYKKLKSYIDSLSIYMEFMNQFFFVVRDLLECSTHT